jgi:hypothetical protein
MKPGDRRGELERLVRPADFTPVDFALDDIVGQVVGLQKPGVGCSCAFVANLAVDISHEQ